MNYLTADFGSTYTKLTAIDVDEAKILATASAFTTIHTDVMEGFNLALQQLKEKAGELSYEKLLCCSSAAGGLTMVALGLVPELTSKAAKMTAASAGAKVVKTYAFEISKKEQEEIFKINPDIVLLCGGTDGGNKEVIINNAKKLAKLEGDFSVVVAGNKSALGDIEDIFNRASREYIVTENVMPEFNKLNIEPAKQVIKELFINKITDAKGLHKVKEIAHSEIIPTPLAVLYGCELLSRGTQHTAGMGDLMAVDLGGATTDIYSIAKGAPTIENVMIKGLPEPYNKRTVEGDLGMRYSLSSLIESTDLIALSKKHNINTNEIVHWVDTCQLHPNTIAKNNTQKYIEELLAKEAIKIAVERHVGKMESVFTPFGQMFTMSGKDLSAIETVIGIGGVLVNSSNSINILSAVKAESQKNGILKPISPLYFLDKKYIFASMGMLAQVNPQVALTILKNEIIQIQ